MSCTLKTVYSNKKAYHNFFVSENLEAGIELFGSEVKSIKAGGVSLADSFVYIKNQEVFVKNMYIKPYEKTTSFAPNATRDRKLLLHKQEIEKLSKKVKTKGYSIMPLKVYVKDGKVKLEIALAKGKKLYDKRDVLAEKAQKRDLQRELKNH
ncbi:MAG: SsrA-binding protein SmpB [Clostridia bacterium]|nr:SsrA-binding protein SmpB [Clostridia bacterium]